MTQPTDYLSLEEVQHIALRAINDHLQNPEEPQPQGLATLDTQESAESTEPRTDRITEGPHGWESENLLERFADQQVTFTTLQKEQKSLIAELTSILNSVLRTQFHQLEQLSLILLNWPDQTITQVDQLREQIQTLKAELRELHGRERQHVEHFTTYRDAFFRELETVIPNTEPFLDLLKSDVISADQRHNSQVQKHKELLFALSECTLTNQQIISQLESQTAQVESSRNVNDLTPVPIEISTQDIILAEDIGSPTYSPTQSTPARPDRQPIHFQPPDEEMANPDAAAPVANIPRHIDVSSLPTFGQSAADDVLDFLEKLELSLQFYELTNEQKAKLMPQLLKDRALTFYRTLAVADLLNYDTLRQALTREFDVPQIKYRKRQLLHQISQNGDPISVYLGRLETLAQNLNVPDQTRLDIMIAGLDTGYRNYIQMRQPATYSDATHALLLKESINPPDDTMKNVLKYS